jgi:nucleoside-diphosphate-sugar epimerase
MHYVITGGCGFIGSHLCERLALAGHQLTVIDNLSTGKREHLAHGATLIEADVTTPGIFDNMIMQADGCIHLAAVVSVQRSAEEWLATHHVNQSAVVALFDALARRKRNIPVVLASSAAVYGDCADLPLQETVHNEPLSAYGVDKFAASCKPSLLQACIIFPQQRCDSLMSTARVRTRHRPTAASSLFSSTACYTTGTSPFSATASSRAILFM